MIYQKYAKMNEIYEKTTFRFGIWFLILDIYKCPFYDF